MTTHLQNYQNRMMKRNLTITAEQVEDFLANDQMSEIVELIKDIANGSYSADALKEDILESLTDK